VIGSALVSIDRAKALKAAQKYLAKGQIDRAITEYEKMVGADPSDARSLLKLGDLYTRKGDNRGAVSTYRKVAHQYSQQGFFLKAVAVYKQILKLDSGDLQATESLAEMYEMLSLTSDALSTYEQVADAYASAGKADKALNALCKIAALDTENVSAWIRAAEALSKADRIDEAAEAFRKGADLLKRQGRTDDYIKVTERLLFHSHDDLDRARDLAAIYIERGQAKAALAHLQTCFKADATDTATLGLLARAFEALGQAPKAASVYKEVARIHREAGRQSEETETLRLLLQLEPSNADAGRRLHALSAPPDSDDEPMHLVDGDLDEVVIVDDEPAQGGPPSQPIPDPFSEPERQAQIARLMAECEVFLRYGLRDKVVAQLNRVLDLDPNHVDAREKLKEAHLKRGEVGSAVTQLLLLSETVAATDPARAGGYLEQAAALSPDNDAVRARLVELRDASAQLRRAKPEEDEDEVIFVDDAEEADFSELRSDAPSRLGPREVSLATQLEGGDDGEPALVLEDSSDADPELTFEDDAPELEEGADDEDAGLEDVEQVAEVAQFAEVAATPAVAGPASSPEIDEALEEADFYLAQQLVDEAREVLTDALDEYPEHPALLRKLAELDDAAAAAAKPAAAEDRSFALAQKLAEEASGSTQSPADVEQVLHQFKEGIKRQVDKGDTETHYDLGIAYMEMGLHADAIDEFKLCLDKPEKQCMAHTMIGLSYVTKGEMGSAIEHFKLALQSPQRTAAEELSLWFEIGNASELLGKASEALIWYEKVEERDPEFRDVGTRIERLGVKKSEQQEGDDFDAMFDNMIVKD
jgi:tetratricopeptide (TPR) repeat protein